MVEGVLDGDTRILVYYDDGRTMADYTVVYIGRDEENEIVLARETFRAPAGETVNAEHKEFENFGKEEGQDMTLLVTADGRAEKKVYYTRLFYDRITFRTEGTYISPISGWAGQDIGSEIDQIEEPVRQGYIFKGWDKELPDVMPEGEYVVNAVWEPGEEPVYRAALDGERGRRRVYASRRDRSQDRSDRQHGYRFPGGYRQGRDDGRLVSGFRVL